MTTTVLTKEALIKIAAPEFKWVEVAGMGRVGLRSVPEKKRMRRSYEASRNGARTTGDLGFRVKMIIDQVMTDEQTPMFDESDAEMLMGLSGPKLDPLVAAIHEFNGELEKNEQSDSSDSRKD